MYFLTILLLLVKGALCMDYKVNGDHKWIYTGNSWYTLETSNFTSLTAFVNFSVVFNIDKCCPGLTLGTSTLLDTYKDKSCLNYSAYYKDVFPDISTQFVELNPLKPDGMKDAQCREKPPFYYCNGTLKARGAYKDKWEVTAFYMCDQNHTLDLMYNMEVRPDDGTETGNQPNCEPPDKRSKHCSQYGQNVTGTNMFGAETKHDAREMTYVYIGTRILESRCHQHVEEFACRSLYPECEHLEVLYPCRSMCYEVLSACESLFDSFPILDCKAYPVRGNGSLCFYRPVECPIPDSPEYGRVNYGSIYLRGRATYTCDKHYEVIGQSTRVCEANGSWSGPAPLCGPIVEPPLWPSVAAISTLFLTLTVIALIMVICKLSFRIFQFSSLGDSFFFNKSDDPTKEFDAVALYHECDQDWVIGELMPKLESECYRVIDQDHLPGKVTFDFIADAVKMSRSAIVVISQDFTECNMELYKFTLAKLEHIKKDNFKVIPILKQGTLNPTPRLESLLKFTELLKFDSSPVFWKTLFAAMPSKSQKLSGSDHSSAVRESFEKPERTSDNNNNNNNNDVQTPAPNRFTGEVCDINANNLLKGLTPSSHRIYYI